MGLISGILTLPLAPMRGAVKVAEVLRDEAETRLNDPARIREELEHVQRLRDEGVLTDEEATSWEDGLIARLTGDDPYRGGGPR